MLIPVIQIMLVLSLLGNEESPVPQPNIVLLTVDTLRADYLGCYGYPHQISPIIDALAEQGTLFEDASTTIGKTGPAFASLFTSQFPPTTGARRNGMRLRPDFQSMTEILKNHGYTTAAIISNWTLRNKLSGLKRGFDYYNDTLPEVRQGPMGREKNAPDVTAQTMEYLKKQPAHPLFLWVHYSDPHSPYVFHREYSALLPTPEYRDTGWKKQRNYASEVRHVDFWMDPVIRQVRQLSPDRPLYLIFCSDHGESLGEHNVWGHGKNVFQPTLQIPLFIVGPGFEAGKRTSRPASIIDLMPTILDLCRIPLPPNLKGTSLRPEAHQSVHQRNRYAFADKGIKIMFHAASKYKDPLAMCLVSGHWKVIYDFSSKRFSFFNLTTDPREYNPLAQPLPARLTALQQQLLAWYQNLPKYSPKQTPKLNAEDIQQLKSLGYLE